MRLGNTGQFTCNHGVDPTLVKALSGLGLGYFGVDAMTHTQHQTHEAVSGGGHHPAGNPIPVGHEAHATHEVSHGQQHHPSVGVGIPSYGYGYPYYGYGYGYPYSSYGYGYRRPYGYDDVVSRYSGRSPYLKPNFVTEKKPAEPVSFLKRIHWPTVAIAIIISLLLTRK